MEYEHYNKKKPLKKSLRSRLSSNADLITINLPTSTENCIICFEKLLFASVGKCYHPYICFMCATKQRIIQCENKCSKCKTPSPISYIVDVKNLQSYENLESQKEVEMKHKIAGMKYLCKEATTIIQQVLAYQCSVCKKEYERLTPLKQHLKEKHNRTFCDLCLTYNGKFIGYQKIYPVNKIYEHMDYGEFSKEEPLIMPHPYCEFCKHYLG